MSYSTHLYDKVSELRTKMDKCVKIVHDYKAPKSAVEKVTKNVKFMETQVDNALKSYTNEASILSVIEDKYLPYTNNMLDNVRWYMNRVT